MRFICYAIKSFISQEVALEAGSSLPYMLRSRQRCMPFGANHRSASAIKLTKDTPSLFGCGVSVNNFEVKVSLIALVIVV